MAQVVNHGTDWVEEKEVVDVECEHGQEGHPINYQRRGHEALEYFDAYSRLSQLDHQPYAKNTDACSRFQG